MSWFFLLTLFLALTPSFTLTTIDAFADFFSDEFFDDVFNSRQTRAAPEPIYQLRSNCGENSTVTTTPGRIDTSLRVEKVRQGLKQKHFKAILIPSTDQHQNEYAAPSDQRLKYIAGFTGSNGLAIISDVDQIFYTDSRYTIQADAQLDCNWKYIIYGSSKPTASKWMIDNFKEGDKVVADARLFGFHKWTKIQEKLNESMIQLLDSQELFDDIWKRDGRPIAESQPIFIHDIKYAGKSWQDKTTEIRSNLRENKIDLFIVTSLDEVAWLFNLRGHDFPYAPIFYSYAALESAENGTAWLFVKNHDKIPAEVQQHLTDKDCQISSTNCVEILSYYKIGHFIKSQVEKTNVQKILLSKEHPYSQGVSYFIYSAIPQNKREIQPSPILVAKAKKNPVEVEVMRQAHLEDSVSLIKFLAFMENEITTESKNWTEYSAAKHLKKVRALNPNFKGESFETISCFGSNAAVVHYYPDENTAMDITNESVYLLDSGGQYFGGTTDVTRTMHYGNPTPFQIEVYTRVLMGLLDVSMAVIPDKTKENYLDFLARRALFDIGLTYGHGSGHGIGVYGLVHEGAILLSLSEKDRVQIEENFFFSDEPGYYLAGEFGIRIENIIRSVQALNLNSRSSDKMLTFETFTLVPYEPKLIDTSLLSPRQCKVVNAYHAEIQQKVGPHLKDDSLAYEWMLKKTQPLSCQSS